MANAVNIKVDNTLYAIKDVEARNQLNDLKSAFDTVDNKIKTEVTVLSLEDWTQGSINSSTGGGSISSTVCRKKAGLVTNETQTLLLYGDERGYTVGIFCYTSSNYATSNYVKSVSGWISGASIGYRLDLSPYLGYYIYVCVSWNGDAITPSDVKNVRIIKTVYTDESLSTSGKAADAKATGDAISAVNDILGEYVEKSFTKTGSQNATLTFAFDTAQDNSLCIKWEAEDGKGELNLYIRETAGGANTETLLSAAKPGIWYIVKVTGDGGAYLRLSATKTGTISVFKDTNVVGKLMQTMLRCDNLENHCESDPLVAFEFSKAFTDVSDIVEQVGLTTENRNTMADVVYSLFHQLSIDYPGYVTEVEDAEDEVDEELGYTLTKPWYMSAVSAGTSHTIPTDTEGGTYTYTVANNSAAYTIRMYKLIQSVPALGKIGKRKLFLTAGMHGNEVVAPVDVYMLAKKLCDPDGDPDLLRLRAAYDIYIIPYMNVFGGRQLTRVNGNLVDLGRNYPAGWTPTTVDEHTFDNLATCTFRGPSAASEYETNLMMALVDTFGFNMWIDHHNSGTGSTQFYTNVANALINPVVYEAATDCLVAFTHNMPEYFGTDYFTILSTGGSPYTNAIGSQRGYWANLERGIVTASTIEVFERINFLNGQASDSNAKYTADCFAVNFFTLKNTMLRFCDYDLKHRWIRG